jgi:endonuclease YncB( thermonuclease family)
MHIAAIAVALICCMVSLAAKADPIDPARVRVLDGDTIRLHHRKPNISLVGVNAPKTRTARCHDERALGIKATRRVRDLVRAGNLDHTPVACSCPAGTEGTRHCNQGMLCGTLKASGRDVGEILIAEGLAVPLVCDETGCPKTPHPWCSM